MDIWPDYMMTHFKAIQIYDSNSNCHHKSICVDTKTICIALYDEKVEYQYFL